MPCPQSGHGSRLSRRAERTRLAGWRVATGGSARRTRTLLNIGKLAPGAADYYVGEVASSAEDYYLGHGEAPGRWVGSLAAELGLTGRVREVEFRRLLDGRHPHTGEHLLSARASAARAAARRHRQVRAGEPGLFDGDGLDVARVAARLQMSPRNVRRLLSAGDRWTRVGKGSSPGSAGLVGERVEAQGRQGPPAWRVAESEVERFEVERKVAKARPGYDLTLRPPKSVSVLWALGTPEQRTVIRKAHRDAVDAVIRYYESEAVFARKGSGARTRIVTDGLVAAAFDHRSSRAGDPLLHTHVVTANMTLTAEGRWQAIDGKPLFDHAHPGGYVYQAHLRHVLARDAGIEWTPVVNGWAEVAGVPEDVIRTFSKRRDEIEEVVAEAGYTSARAHQVATLSTRKAKDYGVSPHALFDRWRAEAEALGFDARAVDACFDRAQHHEVEQEAINRLFDRLAGPDGLTERASTLDRRDVIEALAESLGASADADTLGTLADRFCGSQRVVVIEGSASGRRSDHIIGGAGRLIRTPGTVRYSTPELLDVEAQLLAWAADGFGVAAPTASATEVHEAITTRPELSPEQTSMIETACTATTSIQAISGRPGAGKTYATAACVEAFLASGVPVVGCAVSATAAAELELATSLRRSTGRAASTIARLLVELDDPRRGGFAPRTVLIVDEATMAGSRDLVRLATHLARAGGALKLVGDPDQHGPVDTGGLFRRLVSELGDNAVSLSENNRQTDDGERQAIAEYRDGRVGDALARYEADGKIIRSNTVAASYDTMVADWYRHFESGGRDPMIAGPNAMRRALNARARALLKSNGHLDGPTVSVGHRDFSIGDWVVARKNDRRLKGADADDFVKNGSVGVVVDANPDGGDLVVDFHIEGPIRVPRSYLAAGHLEHGYARTTYGTQGSTMELGHYHPGDASSFEEGYVALTRARTATRLYVVEGDVDIDADTGHDAHDTDSVGLDTITTAMERRRAKALASDIDDRARARSSTFAGWDLSALHDERRRLEAMLFDTPPPVDKALSAAGRHRDALLTRRQLLSERLETSTRLATSNDLHRLRRDLDRLDESIGKMDVRLSTLRRRQRARDAYIAGHEPEIERLRLARAAEAAREVQVRAVASGAEFPTIDNAARRVSDRARREAAQEVAIFTERYRVAEPSDGTDLERLLGSRPETLDARRAYGRAADAVARGEGRKPAGEHVSEQALEI